MINTFISGLLFSAALITTAQAAEPVYYDNIAIVRLLKRMDVLTKARSELAQPPASADPVLQEVMRYMSHHASDEEVYRALAAGYAHYISINDANRLAMATPDPKAYARLTKDMQAGSPNYLSEWARAYYMERLFTGTRDMFAKLENYKPGTQLPKLTPPSMGLPAVDEPLALVAEFHTAIIKLELTTNEENGKFDPNQVLNPDRLVTAAGIAQSRGEVRSMETQLENYVSTRKRLQLDFVRRMDILLTEDKLREEMEQAWSAAIGKELDFTEQEHKIIDLLYRLLDFSESRLGKVHWDGKDLAFDDDADIEVYNTLLDQLDAAATQEQQATEQNPKG